MSRNLRHKPSTVPASKKSTRTTRSSNNASDSDLYAGVDLISDSEEDEADVEVAEEQAIIESEECGEEEEDDDDDDDDDDDADATPQPEDDDGQSSWAGFDIEDNSFLRDDPFFDDQMAQTHVTDPYTEAAFWADLYEVRNNEIFTNTGRRVRFDISDSDTVASDADDDMFPDIFVDQNSLDPGFRRAIENDGNNDNDDPPSDEGSCWDFRGDEAKILENANDDEGDESESSYGSSGYESG